MSESKTYESGIQAMLEVIGGKWKILILYHLSSGKKRTGELLRLIPGITQKVLTQQLRDLEEDGMLRRTVYQQVPPKVEYEITDYGWGIRALLNSMCEWGERHLDHKYGDKRLVLDANLLNYSYN